MKRLAVAVAFLTAIPVRRGRRRAGRRPGDAVIPAVAHAGVNRALLAAALGAPPATAFRLDQPHGCVNVLDRFTDGGWVLRRMGRVRRRRRTRPRHVPPRAGW